MLHVYFYENGNLALRRVKNFILVHALIMTRSIAYAWVRSRFRWNSKKYTHLASQNAINIDKGEPKTEVFITIIMKLKMQKQLKTFNLKSTFKKGKKIFRIPFSQRFRNL